MMLKRYSLPFPASIALVGVLLLGGCGPLVQVGGGAPPPTSLLTLTATAPAAAPTGSVAVDMEQAVTVRPPVVPGALRTNRIPVMISDIDIQYVTGAQWSEPPARLFRRLIADSLTYAGMAVVDPRTAGTVAKRMLSGELAIFGVDTRGAQPVARVRFDVTFQTQEGLRQRHFERTAPMVRVSADEAGRALNEAANAVAADVVQWLQS